MGGDSASNRGRRNQKEPILASVQIKKESISLKKKGRPEERAALEKLYDIWGSSQTRKTTRLFRDLPRLRWDQYIEKTREK